MSPDNYDRAQYKIPEGLSPNPKLELDRFSSGRASYQKDQEFLSMYSKPRASFKNKKLEVDPHQAEKIKEKAMNYKFKMNDLSKISATLRPNDMNWKLGRSALGKVIPDEYERRKRLAKVSYANKLLKLLKYTDWSQTLVYKQYVRNKRWKHEDHSILSEIELQYLSSSLQDMLNDEVDEEFSEKEGILIVNKHKNKVFKTLEVLMNQLNMMYYWDKIKKFFAEREPTIHEL